MKRKLFCELGPVCYRISTEKEIARRRLQDLRRHARFASVRDTTPLPNIVKGHSVDIITGAK